MFKNYNLQGDWEGPSGEVWGDTPHLTSNIFKHIKACRQRKLLSGSLVDKRWCVWSTRRQAEVWHLGRGNKAPAIVSKDEGESPPGRVFRRAQTSICWGCYRHIWSGLGSSRAGCVIPGDPILSSPLRLQLHAPPPQLPAAVFGLLASQAAPPCMWGHEAEEQAVTVRSFVTSDSSHTCCWYREQRICSWGPASEPCAFLLSRVRTWPHPQQRGVVCPRWYLTDVIKDTLPDCLWSWLCVYFYWFKTCLFSSQPFLIKQRVSVQSYLSVGTLSKGLLEHEKVLGKMDNARQKYEKGKWVHG